MCTNYLLLGSIICCSSYSEVRRHVSSPRRSADHYIGINHHLCLHYHHAHRIYHHAVYKNTSNHNISGTYVRQWHGLMSRQLVRLWMGFVSQFDNASHSPTPCPVFQRSAPRVSVSSSQPTLGCTQECDTLPRQADTQTKWVYVLVRVPTRDEWVGVWVGGVFPD